MLFSTPVFLFVFLPLGALLYSSCPRVLKNLCLLLLSLLFYAWGEPVFVLLLLASLGCNYWLGILISQSSKPGVVLTLGIIANLAVLGYFKYAVFIAETLSRLLGFSSVSNDIHLPIGISFFTFQALSYLIDVSRKKVQPNQNIIDVSLYIALFPQLIAGPIVRYQEIADQLKNRSRDLPMIESGMKRFIIGLAKKVLLADQLALLADPIFASDPTSLSVGVAWLGAIAYGLQIYFDFSGYSDMAIGLGKMFGFRLPENFNYPYIAKSITDFWRRWHITLTNWFKDYVYIPLGGNRKHVGRTCLNIIFVFGLSGLWHGANWTFVVWGLWFGVWIAAEKLWLHKLRLPGISHAYALLVVILGWVVFRSPNLAFASSYYESMALGDWNVHALTSLFSAKSCTVLLVSITACLPIKPVVKKWTNRLYLVPPIDLAYVLLFVLCIMQIATSTYQPFIYFQF